jgi:hypothetical protein
MWWYNMEEHIHPSTKKKIKFCVCVCCCCLLYVYTAAFAEGGRAAGNPIQQRNIHVEEILLLHLFLNNNVSRRSREINATVHV